MAKELNDYSGPTQDRAPLEEFSRKSLLKLMRLWGGTVGSLHGRGDQDRGGMPDLSVASSGGDD